eukprot:s500_g17.t1
MGQEVRKMVSEQLPPKRGAKLAIQHLEKPLNLDKALQEQGIRGQGVTLSCTNVQTDLSAAWNYVQEFLVLEGEAAMEGLTHTTGTVSAECLHHPPAQRFAKLDFRREVEPESERGALPGQSAKFDSWCSSIRPKPDRSSLSIPCTKFDSWRAVLPDPGQSDLPKQSAKLDFRWNVQSETGRGALSEQSAKFDLGCHVCKI